MPQPIEPIRIGIVRYLNTLPLVEGLDKLGAIELVPAVPSRLAGMLASGEVDIALASIVDAAQSPVPFVVLPCGMIGCDGPTLTVRLFSTEPPDRLTRVYADTDSHTSVILCRLLLKRMFGCDVSVVDFDARERAASGEPGEWPPAILLIGDKVVTDQTPAVRYPHQLDLGEAWKKLTGLPFVYAAWMCRASDAASDRVALASQILDHQRRHNQTRINWLVSERAGERRWPTDLAGKYLGELLRYDLGEREQKAAKEFLRLAAEQGLLPNKPLVFAEHDLAAV